MSQTQIITNPSAFTESKQNIKSDQPAAYCHFQCIEIIYV